LRHIETALYTSSVATACGVVTITAPVTFTRCESVRATSPVPGGRSITRKSSSPQLTSFMNCCSAPCSIGPRQMTAALGSSSRKPMLISLMPKRASGSMVLPSSDTGRPETPSIVGIDGP
jgi:hypothetical protein